MSSERGFSTRALHTTLQKSGWDMSSSFAPPITPSSTFMMSTVREENGCLVYGRYGHPSRFHAEKVLAELEGAKHALTFSSGMAAINAVTETLKQGDHIVASKNTYGGAYNLFRSGVPRYGIDVTFISGRSTEELLTALTPKTKLLWFEVCTNPLVQIIDAKALIDAAHGYNKDIVVAIDNTFLTPYILRPLDLGADLVMHSVSKYLGGHSDIIMGCLAMNDETLFAKLSDIQRHRGATPNSFDCYLLQRSLHTLELRMDRHHDSSLAVAKFLESHPSIERVFHPLLASHPNHDLAITQNGGRHSGMIAFFVRDGLSAEVVLKRLKMIRLAASLGGTHSLACHPPSLTHKWLAPEERKEIGIEDNLIRLSVGIENRDDVIKDLDQALRGSD